MAGTLNTPSLVTPIKAMGFYSFVVTIPDDDVYSFSPAGTCGHCLLASVGAGHHGLFWFRGSAQSKYFGPATTVGVNTALTGTTGTDGNTTLGTANGLIYLENRTGAPVEYVVTLITEDSIYE